MAEDRFSRQVLAFGEAGQRNLALAHVGVVGVGGLGSQVTQALAYLGVGRFRDSYR
jgi:molybdopterin/thiamine biosynthesis adenylyltransferase